MVSLRARVAATISALLIVAGASYYDLIVSEGYTVGTWLARPLDWLFIAANVLLWSAVATVLIDGVDGLGSAVRSRPSALLAIGWLIALYVLGTVGFVLAPQLELAFLDANQPPVFSSISLEHVSQCVGPVVDGRCRGSWEYPLGTDLNGYRMEVLLIHGIHVSLYVAVISLGIILPIALGVGVCAGYVGGLFDTAMMRTVEIQDAVPPLVVYFLIIFITGESLLIVLLLFGFLGWGYTARIVRSGTQQVTAQQFVAASQALGSSPTRTVRRHVLPAVAVVAVPAATQQVSILLLTEAGIAFLGLEAFGLQSFGNIIARGTVRGDVPMLAKWWVSVFAVAVLAVTVLAFKLAGDGLLAAFDDQAGRL